MSYAPGLLRPVLAASSPAAAPVTPVSDPPTAEPEAPPPEDNLPPRNQVEAPPDIARAADTASAGETVAVGETPADAASIGRCARIDSAADPMRLIDAVLDGLEKQGFVLGPRTRQTDFRGTACAVRLTGGDPGFLHYQLQSTAEEGYVFALVPTGAGQHELIARPTLDNEEGGVLIANVEHVGITGRFRTGDSNIRLRRVLGLEPGNLSPDAIRAQLQQLGYRARYLAEGEGRLLVEVEPGRSIRRVRVHGHVPLSKADVQRELSINARPGALAHGVCSPPKALRAETRPPICPADDLACAKWQSDEIARLKRFLFDKGYLRGDATFGLACGRKNDEVDLHVYLDKGPGYRVPWQQLTVVGNMPRADQRWLRRAFWPRVRATPFPGPRHPRLARRLQRAGRATLRRAARQPGPVHRHPPAQPPLPADPDRHQLRGSARRRGPARQQAPARGQGRHRPRRQDLLPRQPQLLRPAPARADAAVQAPRGPQRPGRRA
ncbi:MAG: hypothetical protein IPO88_13550 [Nannocystis sp.]|uniref:hypothetical protein n=1 Tax=Nannocystis sp. TaxID=1962667 RepID=UPI002425D93F|nr:hypothetical protein [Nannocystis sp.]MBK9754505.1 hypothetical protein [Nannocystis sp.]